MGSCVCVAGRQKKRKEKRKTLSNTFQCHLLADKHNIPIFHINSIPVVVITNIIIIVIITIIIIFVLSPFPLTPGKGSKTDRYSISIRLSQTEFKSNKPTCVEEVICQIGHVMNRRPFSVPGHSQRRRRRGHGSLRGEAII